MLKEICKEYTFLFKKLNEGLAHIANMYIFLYGNLFPQNINSVMSITNAYIQQE